MRKFFVTGMCTLLLSASAVTANAQGVPKFAYVNSQQLFQVVPGRAEAATQLAKEQALAQDQFKAMTDTLTKLQEAYTKETDLLKQAEKLKVFKDKENALNERADKIRAAIDERTADLQQPLMEMIQKALEDYRGEMGLTMIFDVASGLGIAAIDKNLDITDKLSLRLSRMSAPKINAAGTGAASTRPAAKPTTGPAVNPIGPKKPPTQ